MLSSVGDRRGRRAWVLERLNQAMEYRAAP